MAGVDSVDSENKSLDEKPKNELDVLLIPTPSVEEIKKKNQKKDEDPMLTKFKNAETVQDIYDLAESIISGDGDTGKKKLW